MSTVHRTVPQRMTWSIMLMVTHAETLIQRNLLGNTALIFQFLSFAFELCLFVSGGDRTALDEILGKMGLAGQSPSPTWFRDTVDSSLEKVLHDFGRNARTDVQLGFTKKSPSELLGFPA